MGCFPRDFVCLMYTMTVSLECGRSRNNLLRTTRSAGLARGLTMCGRIGRSNSGLSEASDTHVVRRCHASFTWAVGAPNGGPLSVYKEVRDRVELHKLTTDCGSACPSHLPVTAGPAWPACGVGPRPCPRVGFKQVVKVRVAWAESPPSFGRCASPSLVLPPLWGSQATKASSSEQIASPRGAHQGQNASSAGFSAATAVFFAACRLCHPYSHSRSGPSRRSRLSGRRRGRFACGGCEVRARFHCR